MLLKNVKHSRVSDCLIRDDRPTPEKSAALRVIGGADNQIVDNMTSEAAIAPK